MKTTLTNSVVHLMAQSCAKVITETCTVTKSQWFKIYGIPRGGVVAAYLVAAALRERTGQSVTVVDNPEEADIFVDDIFDTGATCEEWCDKYPGKPFFVLVDKRSDMGGEWVVFPWEKDSSDKEDDTIVGTIRNRIRAAGDGYLANDNISRHIGERDLQLLQEEVERRYQHFLDGLIIDTENDHNTKGTAKRVAKMSLREVFKGRYLPCPPVTSFPNAKKLDQMYVSGPITLRSACSHHFVPIIGRVWIGVIPGRNVVGLSKFNRIVDWIAARPQIQEELTVQIADHLEQELEPLGLAVLVEATHMCMTWRGVREGMDATMSTSVLRGVMLEDPNAKSEFLRLAGK